MTASKNPGRLVRTVLALLGLVLGFGTATVAAPATPAYAAPHYITICLPIFDEGGTKIIDWDCHPFALPIEIEICPKCPPDWGIGFEHLVNPADPRYVEEVISGLQLLEQAAANPREQEQLLAAAEEAFLAAAERLGDTELRLGEVGIADRRLNVIRPEPDPWLVAVGTDLVDGLQLMQQALTNPDPIPWLRAGMAEFQEAYQEIIQQQPIGR